MPVGGKRTKEGTASVIGATAVHLCVVAFCCGASVAEDANAALGKPYTLVPEPNHPYCTDAGDPVQLTEGKLVDTSQQQLWVNEGCVGWKNRGPVEVVVDLEHT